MLVSIADGRTRNLSKTASGTIAAQDAEAIESLVRSDVAFASGSFAFDQSCRLAKCALRSCCNQPINARPNLSLNLHRKTSAGAVLEFIALNQQLLIQTPALIDAIVSNPHRTFEAERRVLETKREFFEKERGAAQIASELRAQGKDAAAEFIENAEFASDFGDSGFSVDDALFIASLIESSDSETDDSWLGLEYIEEIYEETAAQDRAAFEKILGEMQADEAAIVGRTRFDAQPHHEDGRQGPCETCDERRPRSTQYSHPRSEPSGLHRRCEQPAHHRTRDRVYRNDAHACRKIFFARSQVTGNGSEAIRSRIIWLKTLARRSQTR